MSTGDKMRLRLMFRGAALATLACAAITAAAQSKSPPSWGPVQQPSQSGQVPVGSSLNGLAPQPSGSPQPKPGQAVNGQRQSAVSVAAMAPPTPRDCRKVVSRPDPDYEVHFTRSATNGYESGPNVDLGYVINTTHATANAVQGDLNDIQVRIEQLRCENENLAAKLDYIIRRLP